MARRRRPSRRPRRWSGSFAEIDPVFQNNDRTAAELLLYPQGFQQDTPTADHSIFTALAGDPYKPAIERFLPEPSAALHHQRRRHRLGLHEPGHAPARTPQGTEAEDDDVTGFETRTRRSRSSRSSGATCRSPTSPNWPTTRPSPTAPTSTTRPRTSSLRVRDVPTGTRSRCRRPSSASRRRTMKFRVNGGLMMAVPTDGVHGRGALLQERRRLLPPRPRLRLGDRSRRRRGRGVVRRRAARTLAPLHLRRRQRERHPVLLLSDED